MILESRLRQRRVPGGDYRCEIFDLSRDADAAALADRFDRGDIVDVHDELDTQLRDLVSTQHPSRQLRGAELDDAVRAHLGQTPRHSYGRWVYYGWSHRLVHILGPDEFCLLRTDRNRYKILAAEQARLRGKRIAIAGLSVGQSAALTLALEGVGGVFFLADFDELSLSNLNRLRSGVHNLGVNKAVLAAREILEIDPYIDVRPFEHGVTDDNIEAFLGGDTPVDLLVEECDDLYVKVRLRERARARRIPVVMDTSDKGLFDVERFDREPQRPLFHGLIEGLSAERLKGLSSTEKLPYVLRILGGTAISRDLAASLAEVKETLSTWPQLASGVTLGGALVADAARRILLDTFRGSGRFYVDLEATVSDGAAVSIADDAPLEVETTPEALSVPSVPPLPSSGGGRAAEGVEVVRYLVAHALLAPSGGNCQPWSFTYRDGSLECHVDSARGASFLNFADLASFTAIGAAAENVVAAARGVGLESRVDVFPDARRPSLAASIRFEGTSGRGPDASALIRARCTNRKSAPRQRVAPEHAARLHESTGTGYRLRLLTDPTKLERVGAVLGAADRIRFLDRTMHEELIREIRWTPEEVARTRDGFDLATLEFKASDMAVLRILSSWATMDRIRSLGGGRALERSARDGVAGCSALGLLTTPRADPSAYVEGGRAFERLWLTATELGLGLQPLGLPYMFVRLQQPRATGFSADAEATLRAARADYLDAFEIERGETEIILFRVVHALPPRARSLRRALADVLVLQGA